MASQPGHTFIGRQQELAVLAAALDDALAGRGRVVMLAGEPGIGKTRIAQELASLAAARGAKVLWGWCYEREGAPPYWPWVQPVRSYISVTEPNQLRAQMGPGAADIAEVIPEVHERLPDLEPPPVLDPNQARFRLFDSFATLFKNAARTQPLMLVLDDLHWADKPSLLLLEFLARQISESSLMVVGTYRDAEVSNEHPLFETLAQLSRNQSFHRQILQGLSPADVGEFILATHGSRASEELIDAVYAHTEGNPFFINEVIQLLVERGELGDASVASVNSGTLELAVPQGVLEVIGQRLNRLSKECNDLLTTAAVIGRQFDFNLLGALTEGITEMGLLGMVEEALEAQVVQELSEAGDRYQFSHALVQQTLLERLSNSRRVRLHARVGEVLETLYGDNPGDRAAELAYHFAEAEPVAGSGKLVKYTMMAGERALETYAQEEALGHFVRGLIAKGLDGEGSMPVRDAEAAALMFGLGRAQAATLGRPGIDVAFASLSRAFDFYAETDDVAHAVSVAAYPVQSLPGHRFAAELMARALLLVPPDSPDAGRLLSRYVLVMGMEEGDYQAASEAFDSALAIAKRTGDVALEVRTLANSLMVDFWHLRWEEIVAKGLRVIDLARRAADQLSEQRARFWIGNALLCIGESKEAQPHAAALLSTAERLRDRYLLSTALWFNELASICKGEWQVAKDFNERGLLVSPDHGPRSLASRMLLEHEVGNVIEGHGHLERLVDALRLVTPGPRYDYATTALMISVVARISGAVDQLHIAESAAATVVSASSATPFVSRLARLGLGLMAVLRGDVEGAREQYVNLGPAAGSNLFVSGDRVLGLLAQTMGDLVQAFAHFEDALAFCLKAGYRPELAWSCHDYAGALLERNGDGDRSRAISLLDESLTIAGELGMRPLIERVKGLQERTEAQPVRVPAHPDGLTQREIEVLRLVWGGKTDREIGEVLVISAGTVGKHVSNILSKTNSANRTEAATYAARHDIVADEVSTPD